MMIKALIIMTIIGLPVGWYLLQIPRMTHYRALSGDEAGSSSTADAKLEAQKSKIKQIWIVGGGYIFLCSCVLSVAWMMPKVQTVQAALNPTATATITDTPTITPTATITNTPYPTRTPLSTLMAGTATAAASPVPSELPATPTARVVYQTNNVPVTKIVQVQVTQLVPVVQTVVVYQTVMVYQTVVVTPTYTLTPIPDTPTIDPTFWTVTPTATGAP